MYIIMKRTDGWCVVYHYRDDEWDVTARCTRPEKAAEVCSWLNGGSPPTNLDGVEWVGG